MLIIVDWSNNTFCKVRKLFIIGINKKGHSKISKWKEFQKLLLKSDMLTMKKKEKVGYLYNILSLFRQDYIDSQNDKKWDDK